MVLCQHPPFMILLLISSTHLTGLVWGSDSEPSPTVGLQTPPPLVPTLVQLRPVGDSLVFLCQAPEGHRGLRFELYGDKHLCGTVEHQTEECGAVFTVNRRDVSKEKPFCCLFKDAHHRPSAFSLYVYAKLHEEVSPLPPPALVSSSREVQRGESLTFTCSLPGCLRPKAVLLLRQSPGLGPSSGSSSLQRSLSPSAVVSSSSGSTFRLAPADGGLYSCLYQMSLASGLSINSSLSQAVKVSVSQQTNTAPEQQRADVPDWPLILGALSAAVLFLATVMGLGVAVHKKVQSAAKEKKMREDAKLWPTARDHVVDLPVSRLSICFKDSGPVTAEYADPKTLSTFANPSYC